MTWNDQAIDEVHDEAARRLLIAAAALESEHMRKLDVQNPPPHTTPALVGEYPRKRTGWLQGHVGHDPETVAEVKKAGRVRIGYHKVAFYGSVLAGRGWKGIWETALGMLERLKRIIERPSPNERGRADQSPNTPGS